MAARLSVVFIALLLLLPSFAWAKSLTYHGDRVVFQPDANLYRLRHPAKPWQLVGLPSAFTPEQIEVHNPTLFLLGSEGGQKTVYRSNDGLRFSSTTIRSDVITTQAVGPWLMFGLQAGPTFSLRRALADGSIESLPTGPITTASSLNQLLALNGQLLFVQAGSPTQIHALVNGIWQTVASLNCSSAQAATEPMISVRCADQVYYAVSSASWLPLFPAPISQIAGSTSLLAQSSAEPTTFYVFQNGLVTTLSLTGFGSPATVALAVKNNRFFLRGDALWEIVLGPSPTLIQADPSAAAALIPAENSDRLYLRRAGGEAVSDSPGNWTIITIAGDFDRARQVNNGFLLWKHNASLSQFAPAGQTTYQAISTSWAASSRIQEILSLQDTGAILWLYNSSNKPNVYKTTDFSQWTRVTLPTDPTHALTVAEARGRPAGSLVALSGVITAGPGIVSSDVLYLQDETGGIQVFLSSSKGALPNGNAKQAEVVGEVSSAQTKRLVLEAADDLAIGHTTALNFPVVTATEALTKLGWGVTISGKINAKSSSLLSLETLTTVLRLHYKTLQATYAVGDSGRFPAIVDYNSSSGQVESWLVGPDELTDHPVVTETEVSQTEAAVSASSATSSPQTASRQAAPVVAVKPTAQLVTTTVPSTDQATLVAPTQTRTPVGVPPQEVIIMSLISLAVGLLSLRGRRFGRYFLAPKEKTA